ncbi:MAG: efflux RND transporter periplasmic adaptor subunit [Pseudomonadota bacterium]
MHVIHLRRLTRSSPRTLRWVSVPALLLGAVLWAYGPAARAADGTVSVEVVTATTEAAFESERRYAGTIRASRVSNLGFTQSGEIGEMLVDVGVTVTTGDVLARLDQADVRATVAQARAALTVARANETAAAADLELAEETKQRFKNLFERGHASAQTYDEQRLTLQARRAGLDLAKASVAEARAALAAAQVRLRQTEIRAPFDGIVQTRRVDEGTQVRPDAVVFRLIEVGAPEAHVGIPDQVAATLTPGTQAALFWGGKETEVTLRAVLPEIDPSTRTMTAVYDITADQSSMGSRGALPIGAIVEVGVAASVAEAGTWLPLTALTESDRGLWGVYVVSADQTVERRLVEVLHTTAAGRDQRVFVRGTLNDGDRVVAGGVHRLVPGQRVRVSSPSPGSGIAQR